MMYVEMDETASIPSSSGSNDSPKFDFIRVHPGGTNEPTGFTYRELVKGS